jgi:hypothetical protein
MFMSLIAKKSFEGKYDPKEKAMDLVAEKALEVSNIML